MTLFLRATIMSNNKKQRRVRSGVLTYEDFLSLYPNRIPSGRTKFHISTLIGTPQKWIAAKSRTEISANSVSEKLESPVDQRAVEKIIKSGGKGYGISRMDFVWHRGRCRSRSIGYQVDRISNWIE